MTTPASNNITDWFAIVISLISLVLTLGQLFYGMYKNRTNFTLSIQHLEIAKREEYSRYIFAFMISNLSSAPISITRMKIGNVNSLLLHQWTGERYYPGYTNEEKQTEIMFSADFPINLIANSGTLVKVVFDFKDPNRLPSHLITIDVDTDKKSKSFTLYLPEANHDAVHF